MHDESGTGVVVWFNQRYLAKNLKPEMRLSVRGERRSTIDAEIVAKSHELVDDGAETAAHPAAWCRSTAPVRRCRQPAAADAGRRAAAPCR